jgi:Fe-S cluster assembly protein SufD
MTAVAERLDFLAASEAAGANDTPWLKTLRASAAAAANRLDWPDSRASRPWKYYDVTGLGLAPATPPAKLTVSATSAEGVTVTRFAEGADKLSKHLSVAVRPETDRITALHYALLGDGVVVDVAANAEPAAVRIETTVSGGGVAAPHTLIVTGANSRVTIVETFTSGDEDTIVLPAAEVIPGPGSEVRYYAVHTWGSKTRVILNQRFLGTNDSAAFQSLQVVLSGQVVKGHLESSLEARGTASELLGIAYGLGATHSDFFTLQDHIGPDTRSDLQYKSALKDESTAVYYGLTKVGLGAKNADANQENRNLLLSKTAKADSDPVLEILTSDIIRASHGATAGPVDQEQLFYMEARGIPHGEAEAMLVHAFLEDVLSRVPDLTVREELIAKLTEALD